MLTGERFVFIHVPRTGGKSVGKLLASQGRDTIAGQTTRHVTAVEARALLGDQGYAQRTSFSVVRNPWERWLSLYAFHAQTPEQLRGATGQQASRGFVEAHRLFRALGSFEAFLRWVAEGPCGASDLERHRYGQLDYLLDAGGACIVQRVLRYEQLATQMQGLARELGVNDPLPWINGHLRPAYGRYYSAELRDFVGRLSALEIERFGYTFENAG